ncbi:MAG: hypothetical protein AW09_002051 [Candidatus Accumulibacter phosphatis]|uniref:Uncharacterized protein n=1 Tax=Candidatus Accumulibacter phosphatis TaxID=327160 RepID=A0A080LVU2_9PROT|nr:MAG: hypothetical protein AW09_002051 [Candidatus Accumulibacter phosphatis]
MVHADVDIARIGHPANRQGKNLQTRVGGGHVRLQDAALRLEQAGQVGIVIDRDAIRTKFDHALEGAAEAHHRLLRQAVDQVDADRLEAGGACCVDDGAGFFLALHTVHGQLDARIEILHADAHAIETQVAEQFDGGAIHLARIDFDRVLATLDQSEVPACRGHQLTHLVV